MLHKNIFRFLTSLKNNNEREWFLKNKQHFEDIKLSFKEFIESLIEEIATFDPEIGNTDAAKSMFRIYRDVRFSKDKSPYKTNFGAHLSGNGKEARAGYYIHLEPGNSFLAGGAYMPDTAWLKAIRQEIDLNGDLLEEVLNQSSFKKYFKTLEGDQLARAPKNYPQDHPRINLLKYKSFTAVCRVDDEMVLSEKFLKNSGKIFYALKPLNVFLNNAHV